MLRLKGGREMTKGTFFFFLPFDSLEWNQKKGGEFGSGCEGCLGQRGREEWGLSGEWRVLTEELGLLW